jgi:cholesterol transport system auxiliary component
MSKLNVFGKPLGAALIASLGFVLSSCGGLPIGPPPSGQIYVLRPATTPPADTQPVTWQLAIALPDAPDGLDTDRIALIQSQSVMDYFAHVSWMDRTTQLVQSLMVEAFEKSGKIKAVARETEGLRPDYILQSDIRDFEAQYDVANGVPRVVVRISARLLVVPERNVIAITTVTGEAVASANTVPAVAAAFNTATGAALNDLVSWALHVPPSLGASVDHIGADKPMATHRTLRHRRHRH